MTPRQSGTGPVFRRGPVVSTLTPRLCASINVIGTLDFGTDQCIVSAIHGLGHWAGEIPAAADLLETSLVDTSKPQTMAGHTVMGG